jgi:hypothetical protein
MKEALISSETTVLARTTRRNFPEDAILQFQYRWKFAKIIMLAKPNKDHSSHLIQANYLPKF